MVSGLRTSPWLHLRIVSGEARVMPTASYWSALVEPVFYRGKRKLTWNLLMG